MAEADKLLPPALLHSRRWAGFLTALTLMYAVLACAALACAFLLPQLLTIGKSTEPTPGTAVLRALCGLVSGGSFLAMAGLLPAWLIVSGRGRVSEAHDVAQLGKRNRPIASIDPGTVHTPLTPNVASRTSEEAAPAVSVNLFSDAPDDHVVIAAEEARLERLAGWPQAALCALASVLAGGVTFWTWPRSIDTFGVLAGGVTAICLSFPVLVLERRFALAMREELPEGANLMRLLRAQLWTLAGGGVCLVAMVLGLSLAFWGIWILDILVIVIACELLLRAAAMPFLPQSRTGVRAMGDSTIAHLLLARIDPVQGLSGGLKDRFGIDLSQSWALGFIRRAVAPLVATMLALAWLLSGITILDTSERGVYERFGVPTCVLQSGLHVHLPWPLGQVHRIENGQVHNLALTNEDSQLNDTTTQTKGDADLPNSFDRLWDQEHPSESAYLVPQPDSTAKASDGLEHSTTGCQLINGDVRIIYRIGLDDRSAMDCLYHVDAPMVQVRILAQRLLIQEFASRLLSTVISGDPSLLIADIRHKLQADLDQLKTGIQITTIEFESIHPPTRTALAYDSVQSAEIEANTSIQQAQREANSLLERTRYQNIEVLDNAQADAAEKLASARADRKRFTTQLESNQKYGQTIMLESWFNALGNLFRNQDRLIILDHRVPYSGQTIDLRPLGQKTRANDAP